MSDVNPPEQHGSETLSALPAPLASQLPTPPAKRTNYFVRHWRGELPLATSYWVNGFLAGILSFAGVAFFTGILGQIQTNYVSLLVGLAMWTIVWAITLWQLVGIWRSASRPGANGKVSRWAGLAKVAVVLGLLRTAASFAGEGIPTLTAAANQGSWLRDNAKWTVRTLRDGTELEFAGGIGHGFAADVQAALAANPSIRLVHVNLGKGGLIDEAKKAGNVINGRRVPTYVSTECSSACTYVFLGGDKRFFKQGAKLGFHAPSSPLLTGYEAERQREEERQFLMSAGVAPGFASRVINTPPESMWYPSPDELVDAGVVTHVTTGDSFALSGGPIPTIESFRSSLDKTRLYKALKARDSVTYEKVVNAAYDAVLQGKSMGELRNVTLPLIQPVFTKALPDASDEALLQFGHLLVAQISELQTASPRLCLSYLRSSVDPSTRDEAIRNLSQASREGEVEAMATVIETARPGRPKASSKQQEKLGEKAFERGYQMVGDDILALQDFENPNLDSTRGCRAAWGFYSGVMSLSPKDAALVLRSLFAGT